jgi:adenine deaminase
MTASASGASAESPLWETGHEVAERTRTAWGHRPPDVLLRGARVLLATGEILARDVAIVGRRIAAVAEDLVAGGEVTIDLAGKTLVPGYVEPHCHTLGPLSIGSYCSQALLHGVSCVVSDDSFVYGFLQPRQYPPMLDVSRLLPLVLRWSLRLEGPRTVPLAAVAELTARADVSQVGELMTRPVLDDLPDEVAEILAAARSAGLRVEGHSPGASARTLGVAAAAGITADHESRRGEELLERLRCGLWAFIRHTDLLRDTPAIVTAALEQGISLERTGFTTDWSLPPWIARHGIIDAVIAAALEAGMEPAEAYACASRRPATYLSLDAHLGVIAPGRLANVNVLADVREPLPERVFSCGIEVARDGGLLIDVPDVDWERLGAPPWSERRRGPLASTYQPAPEDVEISLESAQMVRLGRGEHAGEPLVCVAVDPGSETFARAAIHGLPGRLEGIASTLTPRRLLVAAGADPAAIGRCVDAVMEHGGGIAYQRDGALRLLALPVGGVLTTAPFTRVLEFWDDAERTFSELGHTLADPLSTLLYIGSDSLPGARFNARGLVDTRAGQVIEPARQLRWS